MRIAMYTTDFPSLPPFFERRVPESWWGGVAIVTYRLALGMGQRGHEVEVFSSWPLHEERTVREGSVTVHMLPADLKFSQTHVALRLLRSRPKAPPDVVHAHDGSPPGLIAGWRCARHFKRPLVTTFHCELFLKGRGPLDVLLLRSFAGLEQRILRDSKSVIALTETGKLSYKALQPWQAKVRVIPNGVDTVPLETTDRRRSAKVKLGFPPATDLCLYVGTVNYRKGIDVFLRAASLLGALAPVRFVVVGKIVANEASVRTMIRSLGLHERVRLDGFIDESDMRTYLQAADLLAIPSRLEGLPITLLEAFANGLPVVASDISPHREIIRDGWNGILFQSGNPADLAAKMGTVLNNTQLRGQLSIHSTEIAKRFTWARILDETEAVYEQAAA